MIGISSAPGRQEAALPAGTLTVSARQLVRTERRIRTRVLELPAAVRALIDVDDARVRRGSSPRRACPGWPRGFAESRCPIRTRRHGLNGQRGRCGEFDAVPRRKRCRGRPEIYDLGGVERLDLPGGDLPRVQEHVPGARPPQRVGFDQPALPVVRELHHESVGAGEASRFKTEPRTPVLEPSGSDERLPGADLLSSDAWAATSRMISFNSSAVYLAPGMREKSRSSEKRYVSKKHFLRQVPPLKTHCCEVSGCSAMAASSQPST